MVNKVNKDAFKKLKKLTPQRRLQTANTPAGASMLGLLTPSQFAELFPKYYQMGLPDVGGFRLAISKKSQTKQQEYFDSIDQAIGTTSPGGARERSDKQGTTGAGYGTGTGGGGKVSNPIMVKQIYDYLMTKPGMDHAHAIGIINNMRHESNFNSGALVTDSNGLPSGGLFQHNGPRFNKMTSYVGQDWRTNWKKQIDYALTEPEMQKYMKDKFGDESAASMGFTRTFEKPRNTESVAYDRAQSAKKYSDFVKSGGTSEQGVTPSAGGGVSTDTVGKAFANAKGNTECVAYAQMAGGVGHTSGWSPGSNAQSGNLKPGAWIATFQDGKYTNTRGQSHVARFESYIYDNNGKIIGMNVTHQYNRSGGVIPGKFMFGQGGEFDASNYHQIMDNGRPASMAPSDGSDVKVQDRQKHFKEHPESDNTDQVSPGQAHTSAQVTPVQQIAPPMPHPAASSGHEATATVNKPSAGFYNVNPDAFKEASIPEGVKRGYPEMLVRMADPHEFRDGFNKSKEAKEAGAYIDENWKMKVNDPNSPKVKEIIDQYKGKVLTPINDKRASADTATTATQTAQLDRESNIVKAAFRPSGDMSPKSFDDFNREQLLASFRRKETGSFGGDYASGRNRKSGARGAYQFQDKTWREQTKRTGIGTEYKRASDAPAHIQDEVMYRKLKMDYERHGSLHKAINVHYTGNARGYMSEKALRNNNNQTAQMYAEKLLGHAQEYSAKQVAVQTQPEGPPPGTIPLESTPMPGKSDVTPKTQAPAPSTVQKVAKELSPVTPAQAETKPAAPTTPAATPAPVTPSTPAPTTTPKVTATPTNSNIPGAYDGGSFNVPGQVDFYPMDKRDNLAAVDTKTQQPLFTAKGGERIDITPQQKVNGNMGPSGPDFGQEMDALRQEMSAAMATAGQSPKVNMVQGSSPRSDTPNFIGDLTKQNKNKQYHNPAFERAMNRTRMQETGDPLNNHFSSDNTNY